MNPLSDRFKKEWAFFINPKTEKVQNNKKCSGCTNTCKQSYRVKLVACRSYVPSDKEVKK